MKSFNVYLAGTTADLKDAGSWRRRIIKAMENFVLSVNYLPNFEIMEDYKGCDEIRTAYEITERIKQQISSSHAMILYAIGFIPPGAVEEIILGNMLGKFIIPIVEKKSSFNKHGLSNHRVIIRYTNWEKRVYSEEEAAKCLASYLKNL